MSKERFYVTTPIYYGTAKPHLGSLYSTLIADVINRWQRLKGKETFFLTGTDEHGQKIAQAAQKAGMTPQQFVDSFIAAYKGTWNTYEIDYSLFIRTTDPYHINGVQELITKLKEKGDIYKSTYHGWYCTPCETFVTNEEVKKGPLCPSCGRETVAVAEESYFFRLSAYQDKLLAFYKKHPDFIFPHMRYKEVTSFVEAGLKDLSISRTTISWGVPFPGDAEHIVYVWVDALCNYITALGYGDHSKKNKLDEFWPANVQVLGKDIIRFHGVYWPAMLMAADLLPPHHLLVHGWIQVNQEKMSKSRGNVVDPDQLAATYGADPVRYYLMRQLPVNTDGEFSIADLEQRITSDLANDLGNLLNRMLLLAQKSGLTDIQSVTLQDDSIKLMDHAKKALDLYTQHMSRYEFHLALAELWKFINQTNNYFHTQEPWKVAKSNSERFGQIIATTCNSLRMIGILLMPIMPEKMRELLAAIGHRVELGKVSLDELQLTDWHHAFSLNVQEPLFQKIEPQKEAPETMEEKNQNDTYITIDDLLKVELRVGTIKEAVAVEQSDKLIKMQVDLGSLGVRQILAGIAKSYTPQELINRQGIFVCNLKPRMMLGLESQGMMLIAPDEQKKVELLSPRNPVPNGTRLS